MRAIKPIGYIAFLAVTLQTIPAHAAVFPDVPDSHIYREAIESLVQTGVVGGNPDGTFRPEDPVNRAALLKMIYKAANLSSAGYTAGCFKDVVRGSWYEPFVCNAVMRQIVSGYSDGTFRPDANVNRVEAIKMIDLGFAVDVTTVTDADRSLVTYTDISTNAWYSVYLFAGFRYGILPILGQAGTKFSPEEALQRGEAAAYIHNAMKMKIRDQVAAVSSSSAAAASSRGAASSRSAASTSSVSQARIMNFTFPFSDTQQFGGKSPISYLFGLDKDTVVSVSVQLTQGQEGEISCRLYRLDDEGFSSEYYLGYQEGGGCYVTAALTPGKFQLQLQPTSANVKYDVRANVGIGDSNDGFSEAKVLEKSKPRTESLDGNDFEDWYKFVVTGEEKTLTFELISADKLRCLIYPSKGIDLFGFTGPQCNTAYLFPTGTYYVGVGHASPKAERQTYTIRLK